MREIQVEEIQKAVEKAVAKANINLPADIIQSLKNALAKESKSQARHFLQIALDNSEMAEKECMALCQDTGIVNVEVEIGQDVHITGGDVESAINQGVSDGYRKCYFRNSVVKHPLQRENTGDNTPALVSYRLVPGDVLKITVFPKGAGSENMGRLAMLKPSQGIEGVKEFVVNAIREASSNPCPPVVVGVGIGGTMEKAASLAKKALFRSIDVRNEDPLIAELEKELLDKINQLNIGPQGLGGDTTALGVNIETYPTHIACLPIAVNIGCHCTRRYTVEM